MGASERERTGRRDRPSLNGEGERGRPVGAGTRGAATLPCTPQPRGGNGLGAVGVRPGRPH